VTPHTSAAITLAPLILLTLIVTFCYSVACWVWPFTHCPRCHGTGRQLSPTGRAFRLCRRCGGTGRRLRLGRRVYNRLTAIRREGH
jgi:hypothetical protein